MALIFYLSCKQELKKSSSFSETFRFGYKAQTFCLIFVFHWTNCLLFNHCFIRICFPKSTRYEEGQIYFWASRLFKWSQIQLTIELFLLCWFKRFLTWTNNITSYIRSEEDVFLKKKKKKKKIILKLSWMKDNCAFWWCYLSLHFHYFSTARQMVFALHNKKLMAVNFRTLQQLNQWQTNPGPMEAYK